MSIVSKIANSLLGSKKFSKSWKDMDKEFSAIDKGRKISISNPQSERIDGKPSANAYTEEQRELNGNHNVNSTCIENIDYDPNTEETKVTLVGGKTYDYKIPPSVIKNWLNASSKGKFYTSTIKGNKAFTVDM